MTCTLPEKLTDGVFAASTAPSFTNTFVRLVNKFKSLLSSGISPEDKELAIMMNEMGIKIPLNQRNWKRNSALIVYSRNQ